MADRTIHRRNFVPTDDDVINPFRTDTDPYIAQLEMLWDMISDCIEGGRLSEADLPDDYQALVLNMTDLERRRVERERQIADTSPSPDVGALVAALGRAEKWLGKALAENIHVNCAAPNDLPATLRATRAALAAVKAGAS